MTLPPALTTPEPLTEAPGAKAARVCGILSIIFAVTCVGIPVGIVLGIIALVQQAKAKRLANEFPGDYRIPSASGLVLGIVGLVMPVLMLPFVGIVSAIAIPALLGQRARAGSRAITDSLANMTGRLVSTYDQGKEVGLDQPAIHASLEQILQSSQERNPLNKTVPAFRYTISIVSAQSREEAIEQAESEATSDGVIVFVVSYPSEAQAPGYLAGAARLKQPVDGSSFVSQAVPLD